MDLSAPFKSCPTLLSRDNSVEENHETHEPPEMNALVRAKAFARIHCVESVLEPRLEPLPL
jgi:hypothetical protein